MRRITSYIPNTITCCNLLSGCVAVILSFGLNDRYGCLSGLEWFYVCIGAAAVFDFLDGLSARLLKAYSAIGKELDSLSDLVSFGLAPGMLVYNIILENTGSAWLACVALFIPVMGALRLAKFNVDDSQSTTFTGLPIPANAIFWIGFAAWMTRYGYPGTVVMWIAAIVMSLFMVSKVRMFSLKFKNLSFYDNVRRYGIIIAAIAFVAMYGVSGLAWTILLYILVSVFTRKSSEED